MTDNRRSGTGSVGWKWKRSSVKSLERGSFSASCLPHPLASSLQKHLELPEPLRVLWSTVMIALFASAARKQGATQEYLICYHFSKPEDLGNFLWLLLLGVLDFSLSSSQPFRFMCRLS